MGSSSHGGERKGQLGQLGQPRKNFSKYKNLEKNGKNHLRNITRKNLITKDKMLREQPQKTKVDANVGNVEN